MKVEVMEAFRDPCILASVKTLLRSDTMYYTWRKTIDVLPLGSWHIHVAQTTKLDAFVKTLQGDASKNDAISAVRLEGQHTSCHDVDKDHGALTLRLVSASPEDTTTRFPDASDR